MEMVRDRGLHPRALAVARRRTGESADEARPCEDVPRWIRRC